MQTRGFAHPAQPVLSGAPPATPRPQVGGTKGWLNAPAFDGNAPMSRMQVLSQMLMGAGAAAGQAPGGGNWLGAGLQGAGQAMMGARQYESQRQRQAQEDEYRKLTMELQRKKLEQKTAPQTHVVGGALVDDTGREIYKGERTEKIATTAEAALLANAKTPEERATIARQLIEQKSAMDPGEAQRLAVDRERLNLERQRVEISRRQGSRAAAEPLMAVQTPEGPRYVPRSQAAGRAPADTREGAGPTQEANLRKEYNQLPEVKGFKAVLPAYRSAIQSASRNDRVSDLDLVFAVGKALDPDSVVREGEQVMIANSQGLPDWVQGAIGAVSGGARIQPETRQNLMRLLKSRASAWRQSASARRDEYAGYATGYGLDPGRSVPGLEELPDFPDSASVPAAAVPPPAPGQPDPYADMFGLGG